MRPACLVSAALCALTPSCTDPLPGGLGTRHQELKVCADGPTVDGIDVSKYQGQIDWPKVAASGVRFAFVRVSDGLEYRDEFFAANWAGTRSAGIIRGAYQFFRPGQDAVAQADLLLSTMGPLEVGDLPPVIDVEATDGQPASVIVAKMRHWIDRVEERLGVKPIVYTGKYFWNDSVGSDDFASYPLWIPQYGPTCPDLPNPWTRWVFFQTSATAKVTGITGNVDSDLFNGSLDDLHAFTVQVATACDPVPAAGRIVDDHETCFVAGGDPVYIRHEAVGHGGSLQWTYTTASDQAANFGQWNVSFLEAGNYRLEAYTPAPFAQSRLATYLIQHAGTADAVEFDQTKIDGWSALGDFWFAKGGDQWIRLDDNTGEPRTAEVKLALDALRVTRISEPQPDAGIGAKDAASYSDAGAEADPPEEGCDCRVGGRRHGSITAWPVIGTCFLIIRKHRQSRRPR
ncbi:MAG: hypothetical protein HY698_15310 [Deltaproteobacteria bacterium]|nr:hypothetical protein [Deltaproteobacteria bacterium]